MEKEGVDLRRLRYFIAVCEHGGFSRASSSVGIAQPSLTRQIKLLEQELGVSLFHRSGRGAGPTLEGRLLLDRSKPHLDGLDQAVREVRRQSSKLSGHVALGVCPTIAPLFVDELRSRMAAAHPSVQMTVIEAYSGDLASLMAHGSIDMSLTYSPSDPRSVSFVELLSEPLVLVTAAGPHDERRRWSLEEVSRLNLILPSTIHELRRIIDGVYARKGMTLAPDIELNSLVAVRSMLVANGARYATILPVNSVGEDAAEARLVGHPIDDAGMRRTIAIVMPEPESNPQLTQVLATFIRERAGDMRARRGAA